MTRVEFEVRGLPIGQGGASAFIVGGRARIVTRGGDPRTPLGSWRASIANAASAEMGQAPALAGPASVWVVFTFPRPQSHWLPANSKRPTAVLRDDAPTYMAGKPDIDKLVRALLDGITAVVIRDDSQVVEVQAWKRYEAGRSTPGCHVVVATMEGS